MIWRTFLHVRFWLVLALASGQLTDNEISRIVDLHNQYRSSVTPPAANMQRMLWNKQLSQVAASYASQCTWGHNPKAFGVVGENLFMTLGPFLVDQPLDLWFSENSSHSFTSNTCADGKECGHYTQMVWADTYLVGCATQFCPDVSNFNAQNATILVCNYHPPGNIMGQSPYTAGSSCSSC
ncbi:peptidase inhibitor 16-like, partial [Silurus asotus]